MKFKVEFIASDVPAVVLDGDDASTLLTAVEKHYDEYATGIPDLEGRLKDGHDNGDTMTVDEQQAGVVITVLQAIKAADPDAFSARLATFEAACLAYRQTQ